MKTCDLHTHSDFSDGTFSPTEIIREAEKLGLSAVALTDHNTVKGLSEFISAAMDRNLEAIPGIELSTEYNGTELHVLGLFIDERYYGEITELTDKTHAEKAKSNLLLISRLYDAGYKLDMKKLEKACRGGSFNRAHVASELVEKGYFASNEECFDTVLKKGNGFYTPPERIGSLEAIEFLTSVNTVPVLAHPLLQLNEAELREFLPRAKVCGLRGMETSYSLYSAEEQALSENIAREHGLAFSGGSDFHGTKKPSISLGSGKGSLSVPLEYLETLKAFTR